MTIAEVAGAVLGPALPLLIGRKTPSAEASFLGRLVGVHEGRA